MSSSDTRRAVCALTTVLFLGACRAPETSSKEEFPRAARPVAPIVSDSFSTEDARDRVGEAEKVMQLAGVKPGMWVADIGAGEGYYTVRLSPAVGRRGRVLAEDIVPGTRDMLMQRIQRENLDNVAVKLGKPDDPMLPKGSFDRIFLVHMYHEVESPYAFMWRLRDGLKPNGEVIVVDADRPLKRHGIPPALLKCEFAAVGLKPTRAAPLPGGDSYFLAFKVARAKPEPSKIRPCKSAE